MRFGPARRWPPTISALLLATTLVWASDNRLMVVVSIAPHAWLVEQIGGNDVDVVPLVSPGESPATYQPTDAQVTRIMRSQILFRTGVPFESGPWFRAVSASGRLEIIDVREGIELRPMAASTDRTHGRRATAAVAGGGDPHIWLSPRLLKQQARTVARSLAHTDGDRRARYAANLERLEIEIDRLDSEIRAKLRPYSGRAFFVFHPSWGYFADDYGLRQVAIEIEGKEPSDSELAALQKKARDESVSVIFVQPQIKGRAAAAVAQAVGARVEELDPLAVDVVANLAAVAERLRQAFQSHGAS